MAMKPLVMGSNYGLLRLAPQQFTVRNNHARSYATLRKSRFGACSVAGRPDKELGASRCAPRSTPTPNLSTNSPPNQPVTSARTTAINDSAKAVVPGLAGSGLRRNQLMINNSTTTTFPIPCQRPIAFALVPDGIANQSMRPNTAASRPPIIPAAIIQKEIPNQDESPFDKPTMSKATAVASRPSGNTINIGWIGCPSNFALLSINPPELRSPPMA